MVGILKPKIFPGLPPVHGPIDAITKSNMTTTDILTGPNPNGMWI